ncbi:MULTISPECIES: terminase large subunit [Clostridium]|uniref:terminase large subunit n=1 Tax=Clostridium TaxID=1485 RepID=UPI0008240F9B|nr:MULTISPECIES: terminase TerL endonuclease subunit [Clostridium]PJI09971.1 terminase large subunit [Clostridium sp. CT7]
MIEDRTTQYCYDVLNGKIKAGNSIKLACKRHLKDLEDSKSAPFRYTFDVQRANDIISYAETLTICEGDENTPLTLYPFQAFILGSLLGWIDKETGYRRYRQSYIQLARQNGKSMLSGVLTTYMGNFVNYRNGLILLAATKKDQAKIVFKEAQKFIESDDDLNELFTIKDYKSEIECDNTGNLIRAIGRDTNSIDGFRAFYGSIDEFHAHKDNQMYSLIKDGQKKLKECLLNVITTAGFTIDGACHKLYRYCKKVLNGDETNEKFFIFIAELDEDDNLDDYNNYYKANPCMQYDIDTLDTMKTDYRQAKTMGGKDWNNFLTKSLDMWVEYSETKYMNMTKFHECECNLTLEDFRGQDCVIGVDLSSGGDLTSIVFEFVFNKDDEKKYFVHHHSFMPSKRVGEHEKTDNAPYQQWINAGLITRTTKAHGIKTDYKEVLRYIKEQQKKYNLNITLICYDPANSSAFLADLEEIADTLEIKQYSKNLNDSVMDIRYEVEAGNVYYNRKDELLAWAMNNCELTKPYLGKVMLDKNSRVKRIDPVAAWVDSHWKAMKNEPKKADLNKVYDDDRLKSMYG